MVAGTMILAKPWDVIVCRNDHPCLIALKTIREHELATPTAFRAIGEVRQPGLGEPILDCKCAVCGEPVFVNDGKLTFRVKKHIDDGKYPGSAMGTFLP